MARRLSTLPAATVVQSLENFDGFRDCPQDFNWGETEASTSPRMGSAPATRTQFPTCRGDDGGHGWIRILVMAA